MKLTNFPEVNVEVAKDQPEFLTVPAYYNRFDGSLTFCFKLSPEEIEKVSETGEIWCKQLTNSKPMQPIKMGTDKEEILDLGSSPNTIILVGPKDSGTIKAAMQIIGDSDYNSVKAENFAGPTAVELEPEIFEVPYVLLDGWEDENLVRVFIENYQRQGLVFIVCSANEDLTVSRSIKQKFAPRSAKILNIRKK
tara:strand:+ start:2423 stop:3004 length:582 start_codon:yes stop_codon:yes gene_type:complete